MEAALRQPLRVIDREQGLLFLRLFAAVSLAFCLLWQTSLYMDALLEQRQARTAMAEATRHARDLLGQELQTFGADLKILAQGAALQRLAQGDLSARAQAEADFLAFVKEKPETAQLRFLDGSGQEIVRIDRKGDAAVAVTGGALQNKGTRYYFTESIGLPPGRIYVSRIDLNVEHGVIEEPWLPMLRLAIPLSGSGGAPAGVVILNIDVTDFIADLQRSRPLASAPLQLVNAEGYWLAGVPRDLLFGFMFDRQTRMSETAPQAWQQIRDERSGTVDQGGTVYVFDTLSPAAFLDAVSAAPGGAESATNSARLAWKIVGIVPDVSLAAAWRLDRVPVALAALLVIAGISLAWSRTVTARRKSERERQLTEGELVRVERLASLGSLVAGVAHELNTPIGNAVAVASTLCGETAELSSGLAAGKISRQKLETLTAQLREGTSMMQRDLQRAARLIGNFKQIAVDQTSEQRRRFRLCDLVGDVVGSLQPQFKNAPLKLEVQCESKAELDGYAGPLSQVVINLVNNARLHGFAEGEAGRIVISVHDLPYDEVELAVEDSGKGIPPALLEKIFEPFFTTRLGEGGSGLGLSIVFNIVTNVLGGTIRAESRPQRGTRMVLRFPTVAPAGAQGHLGSIFDV